MKPSMLIGTFTAMLAILLSTAPMALASDAHDQYRKCMDEAEDAHGQCNVLTEQACDGNTGYICRRAVPFKTVCEAACYSALQTACALAWLQDQQNCATELNQSQGLY